MNPISSRALLLFPLCVALAACGGSHEAVEPHPEVEPVPEGQLPEGVRPTHYQLSLTVIPDDDRFSGTAVIRIVLDEPAAGIWMHGQDLDVTSIYALHSGVRVEATWEQRTSDGISRVDFQEPLPAGRSTLHIDYTGGFGAPLRGLYRVRADDRSYVFTQFESISARLAFPGFDEPRFKTPFDVTLTVPADQFAAGNTPVDRAIEIANGLQRIHFLETPPLPTYLIAWAIGPLDVVVGPSIPATEERFNKIPLRGLAAKGKGNQLRYALDRTGEFVLALEKYFGIAYPYRKLDVVAVPDFGAGAMENVGLMTFREWLLLIDEEHAAESQHRAFAYVMAHELAHQWFGNLVTMPWWDDIWLNESFATWMGNKVVDALHPEYRVDLGGVASSRYAMKLDSLVSTRRIRQPVPTNKDIQNAFSAITYQKGGAVLSMFERWMGPARFREGIQVYLREHQLRTATSEDLLEALDSVDDRDVTTPFRSFIDQPGVPLLVGKLECGPGGGVVHLSQQRYLPLGSTGDPDQTWQVPICVRTPSGTVCDLLEDKTGTIELPDCPRWWMPNDQGAGYFRFSLSDADWTSLRTKGFAKLSDGGKIAVADSVLAAYDQGSMDTEELLPWVSRFAASSLRQVATSPMGHLRFMMEHAAPVEIRNELARYAGRLYRKHYKELGWRSRNKDSSDTKLLREAVIRFLLMDVRDPAIVARAARLGQAQVGYRTKGEPRPVEPQLAGLTMAVAVQQSGREFFEHVEALLTGNGDAVVRNRILSALGHAEEPELAERALELTLRPDVRVNEIAHILRPQFRNPRTRDRAWTWLKANFDRLAARYGTRQGGAMVWYAASFCSEEAAAEVQEFFEPRVAELTGGPHHLAGTVEAITLCAARLEAQRPSIERAFAQR